MKIANSYIPKPECEAHDFENAVPIARATWVCPKCGEDISLEYLFWYRAVHWDELKKEGIVK